MSFKTPAPKISFADIFTFDFWRYLVKALWLFFPGIFFLILGYFAFWTLSQGKDLMFITLEQGKKSVFLYCILAVLFWVYVTWYSSRLVGKAKTFQQPNENYIWIRLMLQLPRLMGFTCLTIVILAFLQLKGLPVSGRTLVSSPWNMILLLLSIPYYFLIYVLWEKFIIKNFDINSVKDKKKYILFLRKVRNAASLIMLVIAVAVSLLHSFWGLIVLFLCMQIGLVLLLIIRRKITELEGKSIYQQNVKDLELKRKSNITKRCWSLLTDDEDRAFSKVFFIISIVPAACYIATIVSVKFSVLIGSFPFVIIAFSVLLILGNLVTLVSALARFNMHIIIWAWAFIMGSEHHKVILIDKNNSAQFENRQSLKEYFNNWVRYRYPHPDSMTNNHKQPVYFVLSDGGASRSGYWVASVLSRFEDSTHGNFSRNLFCLSGASGGSVGNATFFNVLRNKKIIDSSCLYASRSYLKSDFLTYTVARMLGPDVFKYILNILSPLNDRAYALSTAMEEAPEAEPGKQDPKEIINMKTGMSEIMTQKNQPSNLPILCINTTRMQDGRPGVISTIKLNEDYFNKRVDVLSLLNNEKDLKLSSAVVLGASFPYLSPAGRIDRKVIEKKDNEEKEVTESEYFVDGGYFDNSGAGIVNEMIIGMKQLMKEDTLLSRYKDKLDFFVLHITNDPNPDGEPVLKKVNSLTNDLAAPIKTLVGSYGSQTSVNDSRLKSFMFFDNNKDAGHYTTINLYNLNDTMSFSMNWVISKRLLKGMDDRLEEKRVKDVLDSMNARLQGSPVVKALWQKMNE